ncbi:hypothetical protein [Hyphomonas oceanitis]|uniref:Uncharacterized protein n=1 Tax=Hyphomonas oceanitis SCH89 TaxID=1280953 RepID=A0A059G899_9PROT|nr:hypothetical protein [Hyphomonas oceanitis]KDA02924.1 hypothetical protein HOC_08262 [Hyphomonas oceanitis SCH89]
MEQSEKNIHYNRVALADIARINAGVIARGDYSLAYGNIAEALQKHFDIGLLQWRRGESPVADMERVLEKSEEMLAAIADWNLDDETLNGYGYTWSIVRYIAFLLDRQVGLLDDRLVHIREHISQYADVEIDYHILDAIEGRKCRYGLSDAFERLATKKRQMLAVETYRTYCDLLDADGDAMRTEDLVRIAEANYARRARDAFFDGGPTYMGGGPDNPYVVDFILAAVLKKIGWAGDTVHKWKWGNSAKQ